MAMTILFTITARDNGKPLYVWPTEVAQRLHDRCRKCSRFGERSVTAITFELPKRKSWPDLGTYGAGIYSDLVWSQRATEDMLEAKIVDESQVVRRIGSLNSGGTSTNVEYNVINLLRDVEVDMKASGGDLAAAIVCPVCGSILDGLAGADQYVPIDGTWTGLHLFYLRRPRLRAMTICTQKVVELARARRWRGFRFEPLDVDRKYRLGWDGIDYLGRQWPPESWYPKPPSEGRSPRAWLEMYNSERDGGKWYDAWVALLDLGEEVLPLVMKQYASSDEVQRIRAARLLDALHRQGVAGISDELASEALAMLPPELRPDAGIRRAT